MYICTLMRKSYRYLLILLITGTTLMACSDYRKLLKSNDWEKKYDAAIEYYETGDYYRANALLEQILPIIKGSKKAEIANFYYGYTYYYQEQYLLASHYFKSFYDTFNRSEFAEEARFMFGYSLFLDSPRYNLDQTSTKEAIIAMQGFINRFPNSEFVPKADAALNGLRSKLERKAYEKSLLYYDLKKYMTGEYLKASLVEFGNFQDDFSGSQYTEEIQYLEIEAMHALAEISIYSLRVERYREAIDFYENFIGTYNDSKYLKKAERIYTDCLEQIRKINS